MTGCLLIDKKPGFTSFESLFPVKKALGTGKVCHTGTLDKFAGGLLIILTGRAVKLSPWFTGCDKTYRALFRFGEETDTLDPEGTVIASAPVPSRQRLEAAFPAFTGTIEQAPPLYSAIHVNGRRAHELAREGKIVEMKKRPVTIHKLTLLSWDPPHAELEIHCSSGTYIRSLARDLAQAVNSRAHLRELVRTRVGNFSLDSALTIETGFSPELTAKIRSSLLPLNQELFARLGIRAITVDEAAAGILSHGGDLRSILADSISTKVGNPVSAKAGNSISAKAGNLALFGPAGFAALIEKHHEKWSYGFVMSGDIQNAGKRGSNAAD
ncbi:hypothetical protein AGMMS50230_20420 [Spirochaetia bacterium]|nr:hypothetical protein AGMMS50230_20420 [Spirochaetia bacterium]